VAVAVALLSTRALFPLADLLCSIRFVVQGDSMEPTFSSGHYLLVSRLAYRLGRPSRGDVVVVRADWGPASEYLKRVVGLPGERVRYEDGRLFINGVALAEPYLGDVPRPEGDAAQEWCLEGDEYLVFGDNRPMSADSRRYGPVLGDALVGRAWYRYWPLGLRGRVHGGKGL
jgi:signal peptidase I